MSLRRCSWRRNWDAAARLPRLRWIPASSISPATCTRPKRQRSRSKGKMYRARTRNRTECDYLSERARVWSQPRFLIPQSGIRNDNLGMCATRNERMEDSLRGAEGEEVLGALDGILKAAEELLQVVAALDEVDF